MIRQPCGQVAQLYPFLAGFRRERKDLRAYPHQTPSMIQEGLYRGGLVPFGYRLEHQGRVNKKNQPIRDLVIDERESTIVKGIFQRIVSDGWETNRIANWLNDRGIATKNGKSYWRATSIQAIVRNPIYTGHIRFGRDLSKHFEHLRLIDDYLFQDCDRLVRERAPCFPTTERQICGVPVKVC